MSNRDITIFYALIRITYTIVPHPKVELTNLIIPHYIQKTDGYICKDSTYSSVAN